MIRLIALFSFILIVCQGISSNIFDTIKQIDYDFIIDKEILQKTPKILLTYGQQKLVKQEPFKMDIGHGNTNCLLFEAPILSRDSLTIEFRSLVNRLQFFYPIIIKLNDKFEILEVINKEIEFEGSELFGLYFLNSIDIDESTRYILVTTISDLISKNITHIYEEQYSTAIYTGSTLIYVPTTKSTVSKNIVFTDNPRISVWVASKNNKKIYRRESGVYWGFGVSFGGDEVANNPSGDNYRAGGGGKMTLGYSHSVFSSNFVGRYGVGIRYQGSKNGDARNLGYLSEILISYQTRYINLGVGGQVDFGNSIRDLDGKTYKFKTAIGPKLILEARFNGIGNIGLEYILMNFSTTENEKYSGNRIGFSVKFFFGK